jgi:hypothetical protein
MLDARWNNTSDTWDRDVGPRGELTNTFAFPQGQFEDIAHLNWEEIDKALHMLSEVREGGLSSSSSDDSSTMTPDGHSTLDLDAESYERDQMYSKLVEDFDSEETDDSSCPGSEKVEYEVSSIAHAFRAGMFSKWLHLRKIFRLRSHFEVLYFHTNQ